MQAFQLGMFQLCRIYNFFIGLILRRQLVPTMPSIGSFSNQGDILLGSYYYTYCSDFWWIVLFSFITALLFLLYVLFQKKVDQTVNFDYCTTLPTIHTVLKNHDCNIYKHRTHNRKLRVVCSSTAMFYYVTGQLKMYKYVGLLTYLTFNQSISSKLEKKKFFFAYE